MQALGLAVVLIGLKMALSGEEIISTIGYLLQGGLTGELLRIEAGLERVGEWLKSRFASNSSSFVQGFVSASLLYLVGAMMIVGSIQDGLLVLDRDDFYEVLAEHVEITRSLVQDLVKRLLDITQPGGERAS